MSIIYYTRKMTRGKNSSFFHFRLQEINPRETPQELVEYLEPQYFKSAFEICEKYNCSRSSIYRVLKNPLIKSKLPFRLEKVHIHSSAIDYI
jgi:DNA invertase Pin-like site-specific DNA recombinase